MRRRSLRRPGLWIATIALVAVVLAACSSGGPEADELCGTSPPDVDRAIATAEATDFDLVLPAYLPPTTASIPDLTIEAPNEATLRFAPCSVQTSVAEGPQVLITESTEPLQFYQPGTSVPPTERLEIAGHYVLYSQTSATSQPTIGVNWRQADLSFIAILTWHTRDGSSISVSEEMKSEAIRIVESMIKQGEGD